MPHYTNETTLTISDLKRLREHYNHLSYYSDRNFMNELFHGLDGLIDNLEGLSNDCDRLRAELDEANGVIR